jgi:hypothetical protein
MLLLNPLNMFFMLQRDLLSFPARVSANDLGITEHPPPLKFRILEYTMGEGVLLCKRVQYPVACHASFYVAGIEPT